MRLDNTDASCERGSYEIVVLSETMNISADSQKHSCCWSRTPGYSAHTPARVSLRVSSQSHCQNQLSLVELKCVPDSENSSFKSDFSAVWCFKFCQQEQRLKLHFCCQLPSEGLSPELSKSRLILSFFKVFLSDFRQHFPYQLIQ